MINLCLSALLIFSLASCGDSKEANNDAKDQNTYASGEKPDGSNDKVGNVVGDAVDGTDGELDASVVNNNNTLDSSANTGGPDMVFEYDIHDFGEIEEGLKVQYNFKFTNPGTEPLIVSDAKGTCGCTVPKVPEHPVLPGESSHLLVTYDSKGRSGNFEKQVKIQTNGNPAERVISIKGTVLNLE